MAEEELKDIDIDIKHRRRHVESDKEKETTTDDDEVPVMIKWWAYVCVSERVCAPAVATLTIECWLLRRVNYQ